MRQYKIFSACLSHNTGIGAVAGYVLANRFPDSVEHACRASKMDARKIRVAETDLTQCGAIYIYKVDNAIGQTGFLQDTHEHLRGEDLCIGRLPDHRITAHCSGSGQIAPNGCEIEWGDRQDEAF